MRDSIKVLTSVFDWCGFVTRRDFRRCGENSGQEDRLR